VRLRQLSLLVFLAIGVLGTAHAAYWYTRLPDRMSSHFDVDGKPDGWSTKGAFFVIYYGVAAVSALLLFGVALLFRFLPAGMMNLPNKEVWLSPEHQQETRDFLFYYFLWFASATLLLLVDLAEQTFRVNMGKTTAMSHPMLSLGCYLAFTALWAVGLVATFMGRPKTSDN
jgi:hypothetical protein